MSNQALEQGTSGNDVIEVRPGRLLIFGGDGDDLIDATQSSAHTRIYGGRGNDTFLLGSDDRVFGEDGNDRFFAGIGGNNRLSGGQGSDEFWIANGGLPNAPSVITDFQVNHDVLGFDGLDVSFRNLVITDSPQGAIVQLFDQPLVILAGVQASALGANDFLGLSEAETPEVRVARQALEAIATGNKQAFLDAHLFNAVWSVSGNQAPINPTEVRNYNLIPFAGDWNGVFGIPGRTLGDFFDQKQGSLELREFKPLEFFQDGDRVIARVFEEAVVKETGQSYGIDTAYVIELADGPSGLPLIESVDNIYNSIFVAQAFAGKAPSPEAVGLVGRDPITGEAADYDPTASSLVSQQVVQNSYGLFFGGDFPGFLNTFTPDARWLFSGDPALLPYAKLYENGPAGVAQAFTDLGAVTQQDVFNILDVIGNGNRVVVFNNEALTGTETGIPWTFPSINFLTVENGLISEYSGIFDTFISSAAVSPGNFQQVFG